MPPRLRAQITSARDNLADTAKGYGLNMLERLVGFVEVKEALSQKFYIIIRRQFVEFFVGGRLKFFLVLRHFYRVVALERLKKLIVLFGHALTSLCLNQACYC